MALLRYTRCSRFHLGQSWYSHIQSLRLAKVYRSCTVAGSYLRTFFGRGSFIDPNEVEDLFANYLTPTELDDRQIQKFTTYVYNNYIHSTTRFPAFRRAKFSADTEGRQMRASRSTVNWTGCPITPTLVYSLIGALLELQERNYSKTLSVNTMKLSKKSIAKEAFIRETMDDYMNEIL